MTMTEFSVEEIRPSVEEIARTVFETMAGLEVCPVAEESGMEAALTGAVYYAGEWKGALLLECSERQAVLFAGRILGDEGVTELDDDAKDALGELTNMLAGNLKPLLPGGVGLTTPSVVAGPASRLRICGGNLVDRFNFESQSGPIRVSLVRVIEATD